MRIDLSLTNAALYEGCEIKEVGGRLAIMTPPAEAANIIGRNAQKLVMEEKLYLCSITDRSAITLTGPMAVWAYLVVFHVILHQFRQVWYDDGRSGAVLIAQH